MTKPTHRKVRDVWGTRHHGNVAPVILGIAFGALTLNLVFGKTRRSQQSKFDFSSTSTPSEDSKEALDSERHRGAAMSRL